MPTSNDKLLSGIKAFIEAKNKRLSKPKLNNMPTYILQKDTPRTKSENEFVFSKIQSQNVEPIYMYRCEYSGEYFPPDIVENNLEWFKMKEEKMYITNMDFKNTGDAIDVSFSVQNTADKKYINFNAVKEAIQKVLNNKSEQGYKHHLSLDQLEAIYTSVINHYLYIKKACDLDVLAEPLCVCAKEWAIEYKYTI